MSASALFSYIMETITSMFKVQGLWPGALFISPRPRGGDWLEDEVSAWRRRQIDVVVSLLTLDEIRDLDLTSEARLTERHGMEFVSFPIEDRTVPASDHDFGFLVKDLNSKLRRGKNILIHCRQGIGRTGLVAACLLIHDGVTPSHAVGRLSTTRGVSVPETPEQTAWIFDYAARKLQ